MPESGIWGFSAPSRALASQKPWASRPVDEVEFYVILVFFLTGPAVQIICEPYHIVDDAVLLVHIREPAACFPGGAQVSASVCPPVAKGILSSTASLQ